MKAYLVIGLPGSGKKAWAERNLNISNIISFHDYFLAKGFDDYKGGEISDDLRKKSIEDIANIVCKLGKDKEDIVICEIGYDRTSRDLLIKSLKAAGYNKVIMVYKDVPPGNCIHRANINKSLMKRIYSSFEDPSSKEADGLLHVPYCLEDKELIFFSSKENIPLFGDNKDIAKATELYTLTEEMVHKIVNKLDEVGDNKYLPYIRKINQIKVPVNL